MSITEEPVKIAIIGGGFSGMLTAINLLQDPNQRLHIHIFNTGKHIGCGVAYAPHTARLLLNVPNGNMSAFPDKPDHFLDWLVNYHGTPEAQRQKLADEFSPRQVYGQYLNQLWRDELDKQGYNKRIWIYEDKVIDIAETGDKVHIITRKFQSVTADIAVLATGNDQPNLPSIMRHSLKTHPAYFGDPWKKDCIENFTDHGDILIIGNGLTMVDTVIGLTTNGFNGTIHTVSPHGYRLKPWRDEKEPYNTQTDLFGETTTNLTELVTLINKHRKLADKFGLSIYPVIDSLRPKIQTLWLSFTTNEKHQFLKKLSAFWDRVRHRLPTQMHHSIEEMRARDVLQTHTGTIISAAPAGEGIDVILDTDGTDKPLRVQRIINCSGPEMNITLSSNDLLRRLTQTGLICPGPFNLGINTEPDGCVVTAEGLRKPNILVVGSHLKGILWESTAVPELRHQAKKIALYILSKLKKNTQQLA